MKVLYRYLVLNFTELSYFKDDEYRKKEALYTLIMSPLLYFMNKFDKDLNLKEYQLGKHFKTLKNTSSKEVMYEVTLKRMRG